MSSGVAATSIQGQNHDRIEHIDQIVSDEHNAVSSIDADITFPQKMLSAISGSILTSLIGK